MGGDECVRLHVGLLVPAGRYEQDVHLSSAAESPKLREEDD